jgi:hypothetical protein
MSFHVKFTIVVFLNVLIICIGMVSHFSESSPASIRNNVDESHSPAAPIAPDHSSSDQIHSTTYSSLPNHTAPQTGLNIDGLRAWAGHDQAAFLDWARQYSNDPGCRMVLSQIFFHVAATNAAVALALAKNYPSTSQPVLESLVEQWARQDLPTAYGWVMTQPPSSDNYKLISGVALVWSQYEPANAAQFVTEQIPPGAIQDEAIISVEYQWASRDFAGANDWIQTFPNGSLRTRALNEISSIASYLADKN